MVVLIKERILTADALVKYFSAYIEFPEMSDSPRNRLH